MCVRSKERESTKKKKGDRIRETYRKKIKRERNSAREREMKDVKRKRESREEKQKI